MANKQIKIYRKKFKKYFRFFMKILEIKKKNKIYITFLFKLFKISKNSVKNN